MRASTLPRILTLLCAFLMSVGGLYAQSQTPALKETVTNQTILDMVAAKLPTDVILTKIQTSPTEFDLSTGGLVALNHAGVPSEVIKAMMQKNTAVSTAPAAPIAAAAPTDVNDPSSPHDPGIWAFTSDGRERKMVMLEPTVYSEGKSGGVFKSAMTYGIAKVKWKAVVRNAHSNTRINDANATFYFYFEEKGAGLSHASFGGTSTPNEFTILKFDVKSETRETTVMKANAFGSSTGTDDKASIAFDFEKLRPGVYKVKPKNPLHDGEYCFIGAGTGNAFAAGAATANRLFDFGVQTQ